MSSSTSLPGARIGKYRILAHIATGGMGTVYKARDEDLGRVVALKVLAPELSSNPVLVERFKREARAASRLTHKNMVLLYECGQADGFHYLAMEYIEGIDLSEYIRRKGQLDPEEARRILIQACKALQHAYEQGVTHRDIKPSNFLLANDEGRCRVKLTDMGLSRMHNEEDFRVTRDGTTVGTVDYMAPEQARDSSLADIRSDIYSLGCTFYHMLAGQPPFNDGGIGERIYKHIASDPPDVRDFNPAVPAGLWTVLRRMLAKHPDDRFQTPEEVIDALRSVTDPVVPARRLPVPEIEDDDTPSDPLVVRAPTPLPEPDPPTDEKKPTLPPRQAKHRRETVLAESKTLPDEPADNLGITPEQRQMASGQFTHATEVIRSGGDLAYAQQLLASCCRLDPANVMYRKMLREVGRDLSRRKKGGWLGSLAILPARGRVKKALHAGDYRKVLEEGEDLLARQPGDMQTHLDMARAAESLGLANLAVWLLDEARKQDPRATAPLRELARVYERHKRLNRAIAAWEQVRALDPTDAEASEKIRELSVNETLARGNFKL